MNTESHDINASKFKNMRLFLQLFLSWHVYLRNVSGNIELISLCVLSMSNGRHPTADVTGYLSILFSVFSANITAHKQK